MKHVVETCYISRVKRGSEAVKDGTEVSMVSELFLCSSINFLNFDILRSSARLLINLHLKKNLVF